MRSPQRALLFEARRAGFRPRRARPTIHYRHQGSDQRKYDSSPLRRLPRGVPLGRRKERRV